jgi:hypothetical protein
MNVMSDACSIMFFRGINDNSIVIRMMIVGDATTWSITYDPHSDDSGIVIYDCNNFIIQETGGKCLAMKRTLAYSNTELFTAVKSFIGPAPGL